MMQGAHIESVMLAAAVMVQGAAHSTEDPKNIIAALSGIKLSPDLASAMRAVVKQHDLGDKRVSDVMDTMRMPFGSVYYKNKGGTMNEMLDALESEAI